MTTLAHERLLPALPLPELKSSCDYTAKLIAPLTDAETMARTRAALEELAAPGGAGEILQQALAEHKASRPGNGSWLQPFWNDMYTAWRGELPVNMNYVLRFDAERWGGAKALPRLLRCLAGLFRQAGLNALPAEPSRRGFLSMEQLLHCAYTRIPGEQNDLLQPVNLNGAQQIAVSCQGHWYVMRLADAAGNIAAEADLAAALEEIRRETAALPPAPAVSAFTCAKRALANELRSELQKNEQNRWNLAAVENSLFALCLDGEHGSDEDCLRRLLCGDAAGRWFDKSLQIVSTRNHGLGINLEHSGCDAGLWRYLFGLADESLAAGGLSARELSGGTAETATPKPVFHRLTWVLAPELEQRLAAVKTGFDETSRGLNLSCRVFSEFSREAVKKAGSSPDAFLQISFQVAQYRLFGRLRSCYEALSTRAFAQGRTDAVRSCTGEALAFAKALESGADPQELRALYRQAEQAHQDRLLRGQKGLGAERHLYGLQHLYQMRGPELGLTAQPAIFTDQGWLTLKHDALSTSGIGAPFVLFFGFGPVTGDGLGIGYAPNSDCTSLTVTAFKNASPHPEDFLRLFAEAAGSIAQILYERIETKESLCATY